MTWPSQTVPVIPRFTPPKHATAPGAYVILDGVPAGRSRSRSLWVSSEIAEQLAGLGNALRSAPEARQRLAVAHGENNLRPLYCFKDQNSWEG